LLLSSFLTRHCPFTVAAHLCRNPSESTYKETTKFTELKQDVGTGYAWPIQTAGGLREGFRGDKETRLYAGGYTVGQEQPFALLVSNENDWRGGLEELLKRRQIRFCNARSFGEVEPALDRTHPEVVVAASELPDGTWRDIVSLIRKTLVPTSLIVVEEGKLSRPYLSAAIDCGVFDFIRPPFESEMQAGIIQVAARDARRRREARYSKP
jgi:hypothetical protein